MARTPAHPMPLLRANGPHCKGLRDGQGRQQGPGVALRLLRPARRRHSCAFRRAGRDTRLLSDAAPDNAWPWPDFRPLLARRFIVPLHALPDFDPASLVHGRFDVACRCVTSALMRSQSVRHNAEICLCFAPSVPTDPAQGGATGDGELEEVRVAIAVRGGLVRELKVDEHAVARRLRFALDSQLPATSPAAPSGGVGAPGAAAGCAAAAVQGMEESVQKRKQRLALEEKLNRGIHCWQVMVLVCAGLVFGSWKSSSQTLNERTQSLVFTLDCFSPAPSQNALCLSERAPKAIDSPPFAHQRQQTAAL